MANTIKIIERKENPLLHRVELNLSIMHPNESTPQKKDLATEIGKQLGVPANYVVVRDCCTRFGSHVSTASAKVYKEKQYLEKIEHKYILKRLRKSEGDVKEETRMPRKIRKQEKTKRKNIRGTMETFHKKALKTEEKRTKK
ncbi:small subunit ribosomal protein S24e [Nematocida sp. AWRm77]|nr:small subunit ribosomal protein S24e [Nematocida sp. AWRm77]